MTTMMRRNLSGGGRKSHCGKTGLNGRIGPIVAAAAVVAAMASGNGPGSRNSLAKTSKAVRVFEVKKSARTAAGWGFGCVFCKNFSERRPPPTRGVSTTSRATEGGAKSSPTGSYNKE